MQGVAWAPFLEGWCFWSTARYGTLGPILRIWNFLVASWSLFSDSGCQDLLAGSQGQHDCPELPPSPHHCGAAFVPLGWDP